MIVDVSSLHDTNYCTVTVSYSLNSFWAGGNNNNDDDLNNEKQVVHNANKSHLCSLIYQKTFTHMKCFSVVILKFIWELKMSKVVYGPEIWIYQTSC